MLDKKGFQIAIGCHESTPTATESGLFAPMTTHSVASGRPAQHFLCVPACRANSRLPKATPCGYLCESFQSSKQLQYAIAIAIKNNGCEQVISWQKSSTGQLPPVPKQLRIRPRNLPLLPRLQQFQYRPLRSLSWLFPAVLFLKAMAINSLVWPTRRIKMLRLAKCPVAQRQRLPETKGHGHACWHPTKTKQRGTNPTAQLWPSVSRAARSSRASENSPLLHALTDVVMDESTLWIPGIFEFKLAWWRWWWWWWWWRWRWWWWYVDDDEDGNLRQTCCRGCKFKWSISKHVAQKNHSVQVSRLHGCFSKSWSPKRLFRTYWWGACRFFKSVYRSCAMQREKKWKHNCCAEVENIQSAMSIPGKLVNFVHVWFWIVLI